MKVVHSSDFITTKNLYFYLYKCSMPPANPFPPSQNFLLYSPECRSHVFTSFPTSLPCLKSSSALGTVSRSSVGFLSRHLTSHLPWTTGSWRWPLYCSFPILASTDTVAPEDLITEVNRHLPLFIATRLLSSTSHHSQIFLHPTAAVTIKFLVFPWITHITFWPLDSSFPMTKSATVSVGQHLDCSIFEIIHTDFLLFEHVRLSSQHFQ